MKNSTSGAFTSLFYQSFDSSGATPCRQNSHRVLPPRNDIGLASGIRISAATDQQPVHFEVVTRNFGYLTSLASEFGLYDDRDFDSLGEEEELVTQRVIPAAAAGDSLWSSLRTHLRADIIR